jgi:hypothetical protein
MVCSWIIRVWREVEVYVLLTEVPHNSTVVSSLQNVTSPCYIHGKRSPTDPVPCTQVSSSFLPQPRLTGGENRGLSAVRRS